MSELKAYQVICTDDIDRDEITENFSAPDFLAYDADEADKVIAELKESRMAWIHRCGVAEEGERHQKYKRCLAMAKWCEMSARENDTRMCLPYKCKFTKHEEYLYFVGYYHKWHKRWLELAEKFKEAK